MKVFFTSSAYTENFYHLLVSYGWEADTSVFNQLQVMRAQFFCENIGRVHFKMEKFLIEKFDREKHLKKLCPKCISKAKKSKRHAPTIT